MKIFFWPYQLRPKSSLNAVSQGRTRDGVLLKVQTSDGEGFADLHPWTEFGDAPLMEQLRLIREGQPSKLGQCSLALAKKDLQARAEKRVLVPCGIRNNLLVADLSPLSFQEVFNQGFRTLKIKCGRDEVRERKFIEEIVARSDLRFRLDFNASMTFEKIAAWMDQLSPAARNEIEYIEDPCPYKAEDWRELRKNWNLALDFEGRELSLKDPFEADVFIYKPAREDFSRLKSVMQKHLCVTVTSMMDHPVGVMHALVIAEELSHVTTMLEPGCATLDLYEPTEFHQSLRQVGAFFENTPGLGIGFDQIFAKLDWRPL